jgi:glyoxylase-like metal-dependent hydrolase (beta-lactamase superfamily II)
MIQVPENCYQLRGRLAHHYALFAPSPEKGGIVLLDGGFLSSTRKRWLPEFEKLGFAPEQVEAILVSHGHIDHTLNLAEWKRLTGARIYAPAMDQTHLEGTFPYTGVAKACGILGAAARTLFRYEIPEVDVWTEPGETLPF